MNWVRKWERDFLDKVEGPPKDVIKYMVRLLITEGSIYANLFRDGVRIIFPMMRSVQANGEVVFRWGIEQVQATIERYPGMVEYFRRRLTWDSRLRYTTSKFSQGTRTQVGRSRWTETTATGWK